MAKKRARKQTRRQPRNPNPAKDPHGLLIPAGIFLGLGIGGILGDWGIGFLIGLGAGFLILALVKIFGKK